jgi:hypothetical protein
VLLDLSLTPDADVPSIEMIEDLHARLAADGVALWLCHLRPMVRDLLERAGVLASLGPGAVHATLVDALVAHLRDTPEAADRIAVLADVVAYVRRRREERGISPDSAAMLGALERRLAPELAAADLRAAGPGGGELDPAQGDHDPERGDAIRP